YSIGNPAKLTLLLKEFFLRSFSIFDVGIASEPPDDVAFSVELRNDTYEEPSVLSVISPDASFQFTWFAGLHQGEPFTNEPIQVIGVNDHLPTPTFPLLQSQAGVLVPAFVQVFLGSVRQARPQERPNRVDDGLEPGSLLAELFESIAQFVAFRKLDQVNHARSVHRGVRAILAISNPEPKASFSRLWCHKGTSVWLEDLCQSCPNASESKNFQVAIKIDKRSRLLSRNPIGPHLATYYVLSV